MKSSIRRLAKDQITLRKSLPPNYFFEDADDNASPPDDLTQLLICLTGPEGTPYSHGIWRVRLDIPINYPQSPPTAVFQTRIFHPNVAEETGAVCLETLKRDWDPKLTLKDILVTISCLLIQPNPDSALNQKAGALIQDDYASFARQARLMTKIHAPIPVHLESVARDARRRGEEVDEKLTPYPRSPVQHSSQSHGTDKAVLGENQHRQSADTVKPGEEKTRKRSLAEISTCLDAPRANRETNNERRKSSRHGSEGGDTQTSTKVLLDVTQETSREHLDDDCSPVHHKPRTTIYRAHWGSGPGIIRVKARVGIRRL